MTIKDVAKYAGVSVATISRVLNEPDKVSEDTRNKVLKAVEETGYQQNLFGKHLRRKKTNIILVMLTSVVNSFCTKIVNSIDNEAKKHGYSIMICVTNDDPKTEERYLNYVKNKFVDGMIVINSTLNQQQMSELSSSFPVIQCSEYADPYTTPYVTINNKQAAKEAVDHLIKIGKKNIMLVGVDDPNIISAKERLEGYK
ncbi:MAG: LacI family DNA-binding transcriptional regulator, partial [Acutalibacteraceae bacterium]|nr:LacI family DNA-binding transcriptional regulator [Acutalibacteraceae bacterium]